MTSRRTGFLIDDPRLARVGQFVQRKLATFDLSQLERFRFKPLEGRSRYGGICEFPDEEQGRGYRIRVSVRMKQRFPYTEEVAIGTRTRAMASGGKVWEYVCRHATFTDVEELAVWLAGHEAFHFLRHSRQIPGRQSETQANRLGLTWLEEWRAALALRGTGAGDGRRA